MNNPDQLILDRVPFTRQLAELGEGIYLFDAIAAPGDQVHAIIDFETTGLDTETDEVIEMGIFIFGVSQAKQVYPIAAGNWLNEPSKPITEEITQITGITQEDLAGKQIPWGEVAALLKDVTHFAAHNAGFDRKFFNRYMPGDTRPWYCTSKGGDVDWKALGYNTAGLELLTYQHGYFYDAHRAVIDCAAVYWLIHLHPEILQMVEASLAQDSIKISAFTSPIRVKDDLKERGYRWNPADKVWWLMVTGAEAAEAEIQFLESLYFNARGTAGITVIPSNLKYLGD